MTLTPYAVLLLRPSATDDEIRQRFHALAKDQHPDRDGAGGAPGPLWFTLTAAYTSIKSQPSRDAWERAEALRSRRCASCKGVGTTGGRLGGVKVCAACAGTGRFSSSRIDRSEWQRVIDRSEGQRVIDRMDRVIEGTVFNLLYNNKRRGRGRVGSWPRSDS